MVSWDKVETISQRLINQLSRFSSSKVCIRLGRRGDFLLEQTGKDLCRLGAAYLFIRVSESGSEVLAWFKVKEGLFGLRGVIIERFNVFEGGMPARHVREVRGGDA